MRTESILITGGTGTLGRAFVKHLLNNNLSDRICIFSRGEHAQADFRRDLNDDERCRWLIGDVRDYRRLRRAMQGIDIVVHAAALKRIEVGVYNADEMSKTNIGGSMNVVEACQSANVRKAILISSDKAWSPVSPYGQSKAFAESLFLQANNASGADGCTFACCRYGNVFASAGSVVPKWREAVARGLEITMTSPECTRFFMRVEEAVQLVLKTIETMRGGEIMIPDLPAYRLGDLAEALGITPRITGLPPYEKLDESMDETRCSKDARRMSVEELRHELELLPALKVAA